MGYVLLTWTTMHTPKIKEDNSGYDMVSQDSERPKMVFCNTKEEAESILLKDKINVSHNDGIVIKVRDWRIVEVT